MEMNNLLQQLSLRTTAIERNSIQQQLEAYINELINHNFSELVQVLYTADVSEEKLKTVLQENLKLKYLVISSATSMKVLAFDSLI